MDDEPYEQDPETLAAVINLLEGPILAAYENSLSLFGNLDQFSTDEQIYLGLATGAVLEELLEEGIDPLTYDSGYILETVARNNELTDDIIRPIDRQLADEVAQQRDEWADEEKLTGRNPANRVESDDDEFDEPEDQNESGEDDEHRMGQESDTVAVPENINPKQAKKNLHDLGLLLKILLALEKKKQKQQADPLHWTRKYTLQAVNEWTDHLIRAAQKLIDRPGSKLSDLVLPTIKNAPPEDRPADERLKAPLDHKKQYYSHTVAAGLYKTCLISALDDPSTIFDEFKKFSDEQQESMMEIATARTFRVLEVLESYEANESAAQTILLKPHWFAAQHRGVMREDLRDEIESFALPLLNGTEPEAATPDWNAKTSGEKMKAYQDMDLCQIDRMPHNVNARRVVEEIRDIFSLLRARIQTMSDEPTTTDLEKQVDRTLISWLGEVLIVAERTAAQPGRIIYHSFVDGGTAEAAESGPPRRDDIPPPAP